MLVSQTASFFYCKSLILFQRIKKIIKAILYYQTPSEPLKGKVLNEFIKKFELEKFSLSDGMCFGEWGLIYDIRRTTSIYAVEDTDLFYLEKEPFNRILCQKFLKSDNDKVKFIININSLLYHMVYKQ